MLPALWGAMKGLTIAQKAISAGVLAASLAGMWGWGWLVGHRSGADDKQRELDASIMHQAAEAVKQVVKAEAMESQVVKAIDQAARDIQAHAEHVKKEVRHDAKRNTTPLSAAVVRIYDRLISVPNEAGRGVPSADSGAGTPEIPRGGVAVETPARVSIDNGEEIVELTTDELVQAATDFAEKYALMKNAYRGLSRWNDGREQLELERLQPD